MARRRPVGLAVPFGRTAVGWYGNDVPDIFSACRALAKTTDGRDITVILVSIDDTDPKTGAATLKKAQAIAPAFVGDVQVEVMGHFEAVATPGAWLLPGVSK